MANLAEVSQCDTVIRPTETGEAATAGADGLANIQAKQLANRTKYLKDNYLPLAGGILKGALLHKNGGWFDIIGGESSHNSASLQLASSDADGRFNLNANNGSDHIALRGYTNGVLTWRDNDLAGSAIVAKSLGTNGYVKYASGLVIQWAQLHGITFNSEGIYTYTFPISFSAAPSLTVTYNDSVSQMATYDVDALEILKEKVNLVARSVSNKIANFSTDGAVSIIAIGY